MFSKCANPACRAEFDYHQGRFFRFPKPSRQGEQAPNTHSVEHLWLCGPCSSNYCLKYLKGTGIVLELLSETVVSPKSVLLIAKA